MKVSVTDDGYLVTSGGGSAQQWVEIAPRHLPPGGWARHPQVRRG